MTLTNALWVVAATCSFIAAAFFLRFWRSSRDAFFALFTVAFVVLGAHWALLGMISPAEQRPLHHVFRLVGFLFIIVAVLLKNRK
jgi:hypothetical protein